MSSNRLLPEPMSDTSKAISLAVMAMIVAMTTASSFTEPADPAASKMAAVEQSFVELKLWYFQFASGLKPTNSGQPNGNGTEILYQSDPSGCASGFVVAADGIVVTNFHVVRRAQKIEAHFEDGSTALAEQMLDYDRANDLGLIKLKLTKSVTPVELDDSPVSVLDDVYSIGNPGCEGMSVTKGMVNRIPKDNNGAPTRIQHSATIAPGNSGGPLVRGGKVVGVNSSSWVPYEIHFAVPATFVKELLQKSHKPTPLSEAFSLDPAKIRSKVRLVGATSGRVNAGTDGPQAWISDAEFPNGFTDVYLRVDAEPGRDLALAVFGPDDEKLGYADSRGTSVEELFFSLDNPTTVEVWVINYGAEAASFGIQLFEIIW
jgi:S1-C subfamily serine protease